jgi:transposase-like protein
VLVQRFLCLACGRSYTVRPHPRWRYSEAFARAVTHRHVEGESFRVIAREIFQRTGRRISPTSLQQMVAWVASRCKTAGEMSRDLHPPGWSGFLVVDEKRVSVRGKSLWFYEAVDTTGDIVHWLPVSECSVSEAVHFLEQVVALGYPCRGITSDLDSSLTLAIERVYAEKPHQYCIKHALGVLELLMGYRTRSALRRRLRQQLRKSFERLPLKKGVYLVRASHDFLEQWHRSRLPSRHALAIEQLHEHCRRILCARSQGRALDLLAQLRRSRLVIRTRKWRAVSFLERHWVHLMHHHTTHGLPRTSNMAETFNKQLKRRLKTLESFQHQTTAVNYMNLLVAYLRLKPYTDCRGARKHLNGKTRLEAAGLSRTKGDWLDHCLKTP